MKGFVFTCGSSLQARPEGRHQSRISDLTRLSHSDLEGTAGDVAAVKANIYRMNTILLWNEPDGVLICRNREAPITAPCPQSLNCNNYYCKDVVLI